MHTQRQWCLFVGVVIFAQNKYCSIYTSSCNAVLQRSKNTMELHRFVTNFQTYSHSKSGGANAPPAPPCAPAMKTTATAYHSPSLYGTRTHDMHLLSNFRIPNRPKNCKREKQLSFYNSSISGFDSRVAPIRRQ